MKIAGQFFGMSCSLILAVSLFGCAEKPLETTEKPLEATETTVESTEKTEKSETTETMDEPRITLREARDYQNLLLKELVAFVPRESITGGMEEPIARMPGMSCNWDEGAGASWERAGVFLPGGFDVEVGLDTDLAAVLDAIAARYEELPGWTVDSSGDGYERLVTLTSHDDYSFYVRQYPDSEGVLQFSVSSFSPCIEAPEGFDPFGEY